MFLQACEVGRELQLEDVEIASVGGHRHQCGCGDVGLLIFYGEGDLHRWNLEGGVLR